jgi:hypothetical protein
MPSSLNLKREVEDLLDSGPRRRVALFPENMQYLCERIAAASSGSPLASIDAFLERQPSYREVGQAAIAHLILEAERRVRANLLRRPGDGRNESGEHWLTQVFRLVCRTTRLDACDFENIRFVTFNYDRTIEEFFSHAISNLYGLRPSAAHEFQSEWIRVAHVYGSIGDVAHLPFGATENRAMLSSTSSIKIADEDRLPSSVDSEVGSFVEWAQNVMFLGFGFLPINVKRLRLGSFLGEVNGTCLGMSDSERSSAMELFPQGKLDLWASHLGCREAIRSFYRRLR